MLVIKVKARAVNSFTIQSYLSEYPFCNSIATACGAFPVAIVIAMPSRSVTDYPYSMPFFLKSGLSNGKCRKYYKGYAYDTHPVRSPISLQQFLESPNQLIIFLRTHHTEPHIGRVQERKRGTVTNHKPLSYTTVKQHI